MVNQISETSQETLKGLDKEALRQDVGSSLPEQLAKLKEEGIAPLLMLAGIALISYLGKDKEIDEEEGAKEELNALKSDIEAPLAIGEDVLPADQGEVSFDLERFNELREQKGDKVAFYCNEIYQRYATALEFNKRYKSEVSVENYDGTARNINNNCVGFLMSALSGLPFKITAEVSNNGRYLSGYHWGGKDGLENFIPDAAGNDPSKYKSYENLDPDKIDEQVGQHLSIGEYAIAAFYNHVLLIYKDINGNIKMVHSGADVGEEGQGRSWTSQVNETSLYGYAKRMKGKGKPMDFAFLPISNLVEIAKNSGNQEVDNHYFDNMEYAA